jgi:general secretion pathway protein G
LPGGTAMAMPPRMRKRRSQAGLTMLEIMIVIAILGIVMGLVVVPKLMDAMSHSRTQLAKLAVDKMAYEQYPKWALMNTSKECPDSLLEMLDKVGRGRKDLVDPWDNEYRMECGQGQLPAHVKESFGAISNGKDKRPQTGDDIKSYEPQ